MAARGGIVRGRLPWDINGRFSSARRGRPPISIRLGVNMQSWCSKWGWGGKHGCRLSWGEGRGWWRDGGDFWGGHSSEWPRGLIVSHTGHGSDFGCSSRGNGHRLNYFFRFFLCKIKKKKKKHTKPHKPHAHSSAGIFSAEGDNLPSMRQRRGMSITEASESAVKESVEKVSHAFKKGNDLSMHSQKSKTTMLTFLTASKTDTTQIKFRTNLSTTPLQNPMDNSCGKY